MIKIYLTVIFFIIHLNVTFALEARWIGVAGLIISDGKTTLIFDPAITKPKLSNWILGTEFKSDESLVNNKLKALNVEKVDALFASHTHFDHVADVGFIAKKMNSTVYGGPSLKNVVLGQYKDLKFKETPNGDIIKIGEFIVHMHLRPHSPILGNWKFMPGDVGESFKSQFYEYREGETWNFFVEHPKGNIFIDQGSRFSPESEKYIGKVHVHFLGIANKLSLEDLVKNNIVKLGAKYVYPMHFDFFFLQSKFLESLRLPGTDLDKIEPLLKKISPNQIFRIPQINEALNIFQ